MGKTKTGTEEKIKKILAKHLAIPAPQIKETDSFTSDLNADPTDLSEALEEVYATFAIEEHRTNFDKVRELIDYVKDHLDEI